MKEQIQEAAKAIHNAKRVTAFTGAGISVESGVPPFRGAGGLWNRYPEELFEIDYFFNEPEQSWELMREIFYDLFGKVKPNAAHYALAEMENRGLLKTIITQNIDNLHTLAGSKTVYEFHGTLGRIICPKCGKSYPAHKVSLETLPPGCSKCGAILKPDVVFFGEGIPPHAFRHSFAEAERSDLFLIIGSTGLVTPANQIPKQAKENGATIIEINIEPSAYTSTITDIFLQGPATEMMEALIESLLHTPKYRASG